MYDRTFILITIFPATIAGTLLSAKFGFIGYILSCLIYHLCYLKWKKHN
jgi:hypothetical protein